MAKYRKKPVEIEAFQLTAERWKDHADWPKWLTEAWEKPRGSVGELWSFPRDKKIIAPFIRTLEGNHIVSFGDWIIRGVKGELYPCKPDIFSMTYEVAE